MTSENK